VKPLQLRTSLTLAYSAILSVVLSAVGIGFHTLMVRQLDASATSTLQEKARALHGYLRFANGMPELAYDRSDVDEAAFINDATRYYQVYDSTSGRLLAQSPGMEALGLHYTPQEVAEFQRQPATSTHDVQTDSGRLRLTTSVITPSSGEEYVVQVGETLAAMDRALSRVDRLLWINLLAGVLLSLLLGRWLAGRALTPLSSLAASTERIGIANLHDRLANRGTGDELDRVADAFNQALARVERSVGEMRQFSAALAHELRTPIAILRGEAELELVHAASSVERRERLASQIDEYDRLTRLINQILTLARAEAGEIALASQPVALGELAVSVVEQIEPVASARNIALTCSAPEPVAVRGDAGWLERLLLILLDNAIKFTPDGGRVSVDVSTTGTTARLKVADTGSGIPLDAIPHLFKRFYRVEADAPRQNTGAGLGLALAKWIADRHHATIEVNGQPGAGTTVVVIFTVLREA